MSFNVSEFRARMRGGGARSNKFRVIVNNPPAIVGLDSRQMSFMAKSAQFPESTVGVVEVPYFGRQVKFAGDRTFAEWTTTVINDETFDVRNALERWSSAIATHGIAANTQRQNGATSNPFSYVSSATIEQFSKDGRIIKRETLLNLWPVSVGQIDLSWDNADAIEEFDVTWSIDGVASDSKL